MTYERNVGVNAALARSRAMPPAEVMRSATHIIGAEETGHR